MFIPIGGKNLEQKIGAFAFIVGVILAIVMGLAVGVMGTAEWMGYIPLILVLLGIIVGFLNIGDKEVMPFLVAAIALMVVGTVGTLQVPGAEETVLGNIDTLIPPLGTVLAYIVSYITVFAAPAALIVALIDFYRLASTPKGTAVK